MRPPKYDYVIGIDPDTDKSGFAVINVAPRIVQLANFPLPKLLHEVTAFIARFAPPEEPLQLDRAKKAVVVVELDRIHKHNWHITPFDTKAVAARKGFDQGRCYEVGCAVSEYLQHQGIEVIEKPPLAKCWKGQGGKISHGEVLRLKGINIMGGRKITNQEQRDALLLALDVSGIPLILEPENKNR